jgi:outer membrane protein assembly factor BamA
MTGTQQNLYNLGVFQRVGMAIQNPAGETERKYLLYDLQEADRYRVAIGGGAEIARIGGGPTTGLQNPGGAAGFSPRVSLDIARLNLWGLAHRGILVARASTLEQLGSLSYFWPQFRGATSRDVTFTALADRAINVNTFTSRRLEASAQLAQKLTKSSTVLGSFSFRRVGVSDLKINPLLVPLLAQPVRVGILSGAYLFDRRDNPIDATKGMFNTLDAGVSSRIFGSQRSFTRLLATNSTYHRFGKNLVFARRIEFGWLAPFAVQPGIPDDQAIPLPERFYAGGANSHRGFPENQSGPRDLVTGFPIGGNAALIHNAELRFPLLGNNIGGVLFHDMGNTYSTIQAISFRVHQRNLEDFNYMVHAVGFGIRYRTPVGPFRADFAYSINSPRFFGLKGTTQELLEGTAQSVTQRISRFQFFISIGQAF